MAKRKKKWGLSMRKVREILRLGLKNGEKLREISRSCSVAHKTAGKYLKRARKLSLSHEQVEKMDDIELKGLIIGFKKEIRGKPEPDWNYIHEEMKKKGVTRQLLWQEYRESNPEGYQSTQFCDLYARWKKTLKISLRQTHKAGEKTFVDYAGQKIPITNRPTGEIKDAEIFAPMLPLRDSTKGIVTADHINALPKGCLVVLVTRAGICDMETVRKRVLSDELALAADVFDREPLPLDDPLLGRHNVVHTPHIAGRTMDANQEWARYLADQFMPC